MTACSQDVSKERLMFVSDEASKLNEEETVSFLKAVTGLFTVSIHPVMLE